MPTEVDATKQAEALVRRYCGWIIAPAADETLRIDGNGAHTLILPTLHINSIATVQSDGATIAPDAYDWSTAGLLKLRAGCWSHRFGGISVTLNHGFETMPDEVAAVITRIADRALNDVGMLAQVGQVRYGTASDGVSIGGSLTLFDRAALDAYRLPGLP